MSNMGSYNQDLGFRGECGVDSEEIWAGSESRVVAHRPPARPGVGVYRYTAPPPKLPQKFFLALHVYRSASRMLTSAVNFGVSRQLPLYDW